MQVQALAPAAIQVQALAQLQGAALDAVIFRMRPKKDAPMEGRPWVWGLMLAERPVKEVSDFVEALDALCLYTKEQKKSAAAALQVCHSNTQDGPTVKWLMGLRKNAGGGGEDQGLTGPDLLAS